MDSDVVGSEYINLTQFFKKIANDFVRQAEPNSSSRVFKLIYSEWTSVAAFGPDVQQRRGEAMFDEFASALTNETVSNFFRKLSVRPKKTGH